MRKLKSPFAELASLLALLLLAVAPAAPAAALDWEPVQPGIETADTAAEIPWLVGKIARLRIFDDEQGVMNRSLADTGGDALVISQFTLHASTKKGNRPSYIRAARPEQAEPLYQQFCQSLASELARPVATGKFGADMQVTLTNAGPVTILIDTQNKE